MRRREQGARWLGCLVCLAGALSALTAVRLAAQRPVSTDSSVPLFTVMAAVNAAGYDADLDSPQNSPVRRAVRQQIASAKPASLEALRTFYAAHRQPSAARDLSQYISFALLINGPPDFTFRVREIDLPEEVAAMRDLRPLLAAFYQEAGLEQLWEEHRAAYERELERYNEGLARVMLEVNGYLRIPSSGFLGRSFWIYVDLLGAPGQANARSFGPDYYVVVGAAAQPQLEEVRHGYLHYALEPMAGKYGALLRSKSDLQLFAEEAPALDAVLRRDFRLLLTESLIRAVELRMSRGAPAAKQQRVQEVLADGHILAPYFFEALEKFEKQDAGMRLYYEEMIEKIDVGREQKRLVKVSFRPASPAAAAAPHVLALTPGPAAAPTPAPGASSAAAASAAEGATAPGSGPSEQEKLIAQGEDALARKDFAAARLAFQAALETKGLQQGQAIYGLALVATQEKQPEVAKSYFQQTLQFSKDPRLLAWSHIYLGRIFDMEKNRELALKHYQRALEAGDTQPATRLAAERGLQSPFRREAARIPDKDENKP